MDRRSMKIIRSATDYEAALRAYEAYFDHPPAPGSEDGDSFEILGALIAKYEEEAFPFPEAKTRRGGQAGDGEPGLYDGGPWAGAGIVSPAPRKSSRATDSSPSTISGACIASGASRWTCWSASDYFAG